MTPGKVLPSLKFNFTTLTCKSAANGRQTDSNTPLPSVPELSPRKITLLFGINHYRLRYVGNGARGVIYEARFSLPVLRCGYRCCFNIGDYRFLMCH